MDITDIRIKKVDSKNSGSKLLAYVAVTFDNCLVLHNIRVIKGQREYLLRCLTEELESVNIKTLYILLVRILEKLCKLLFLRNI